MNIQEVISVISEQAVTVAHAQMQYLIEKDKAQLDHIDFLECHHKASMHSKDMIIKDLRKQIELDEALKDSMERQICTLQAEIDLLKLKLEDIKPDSSLTHDIKKLKDINTGLEAQLNRASFDILCKNKNLEKVRRLLIDAKNELFRCHRAGGNCNVEEHGNPTIQYDEV